MAYGFNYKYDATNQLLDRARQIKNPVNRKLAEEDMRYVLTLTDVCRECNTAITQLFLIKAVIEKMDDPDLGYIATNFRRILNSLLKQRNKGWAIRCALNIVKPTPEEKTDIDRYIRETRKRIGFIESVVIPENLKLTPIHEYLDIIGKKTLHEDICKEFPTKKAMAAANNGEDPEALDRYVRRIIETVKQAGREEAYRERLLAYKDIADKHYAQLDEEKRNAEAAEKRKSAEEAMIGFHRMFNNAVFRFKGDQRINMGRQTLLDTLNTYGRDIYFVLCCYVFGKKIVYRYIGEDGPVVLFKHAKIYRTREEAEEAAQEYREKFPSRLFDTVQFSCIESA